MRRLLKERKLKRIKDKKLKYGRWDLEDEDDEYDYEDELLSRSELIEEALKEYMYQFGLSIYQNKQGGYYFKQFNDDIDIRGFDELDIHHFSLREKEPNFFEKLMEVVPETKIHLTGDMETAVFDLYEKDAVMADILDQMVSDEMLKCKEIMKSAAYMNENEPMDLSAADELTRVEMPTKEDLVLQTEKVAEAREAPLAETRPQDDQPDTEAPTGTDGEQWEVYDCGVEERVEKVSLPKPVKVRRVSKLPSAPLSPGMVKDNINNR